MYISYHIYALHILACLSMICKDQQIDSILDMFIFLILNAAILSRYKQLYIPCINIDACLLFSPYLFRKGWNLKHYHET